MDRFLGGEVMVDLPCATGTAISGGQGRIIAS
jgi:hypothetical protein